MRLSHVVSTVVRCVSVALGLLCASASLAADGPGLVDAARNGDVDAVRSLLKGGADPNQAAPDGSTAVHWAVHGDNLAMLNALLAAGAKPDGVTRYKIAPLTLAAQNGNAALVERLLAAGANPDTASEEGQTALMTAARNGSVAAVRALLKRGAQVGLAESFRGQTALMFAAGEGNTDAAKLLLEFGAKLNERSKGGYTPLLFAVRNNRSRDGQVPVGAGRQRQRPDTRRHVGAQHRDPERRFRPGRACCWTPAPIRTCPTRAAIRCTWSSGCTSRAHRRTSR